LKFGREIWRGLFVGFAVLLCAHVCAPEASAQLDQWGFWENGVTEHWWLSSEDFTAEDAAQAVARWNRVGKVADEKAWAGDYLRGGETYGTYMRWSPEGFVITHVDKCAARVTGLVYGRVVVTPTVVLFYPELDKTYSHSYANGHPSRPRLVPPREVLRFVPVRWRGERLLVDEALIDDFGDYAAGLGHYNQWVSFPSGGSTSFFTHSEVGAPGDVAEVDNRPPAVPPGYERFLKKPVEAHITAVGRKVLRRDYRIESKSASLLFERASLTYVTIDAGTEHGVRAGMILRVAGGGDEDDSVVITRAGRRASTAAVVREVQGRGAETYYDLSEGREKKRSKVVAGWRLTTAPF